METKRRTKVIPQCRYYGRSAGFGDSVNSLLEGFVGDCDAPSSFMGLGLGGQRELKSCAAWGVVGSPQAAAMRLNDGSVDPKPHAGAVRLGGEKWIESICSRSSE